MKRIGIHIILGTCLVWLAATLLCPAAAFSDPMPDDSFYPAAGRDYTEQGGTLM